MHLLALGHPPLDKPIGTTGGKPLIRRALAEPVAPETGGMWEVGLGSGGILALLEAGVNASMAGQPFAAGMFTPIIQSVARVHACEFAFIIELLDIPLSLQIIQYPHPTLRHRSKPLRRVDAELRKIIAEMFELMYEHEGVGLAANQVDLPYRLFVANPEGDPDAKELEGVFINPVISGGRGLETDEEGCLSIPGIRAPVTRNTTIKIQGYDFSGNDISGEVEGFLARVIQHETDHLDGTLFIDRLGPAQAGEIRGALEEFELAYQSKLETGELPSAEQVASRLMELERLRT